MPAKPVSSGKKHRLPAANQRPPAEAQVVNRQTPPVDRQQAVQRIEHRELRHEFHGPLPPPDALERYEAISPGFADRIVKMAEAEQAHRHTLEASVVGKSFEEAARGQRYGLAIGIAAIIAGSITAIVGAPIPGAIIGGGGVIGLVSVFVLGRFFPTSKPAENNE